ncbi:MAG: hypothetical protein ABSG54_20045 [Terriglobia bacterium]
MPRKVLALENAIVKWQEVLAGWLSLSERIRVLRAPPRGGRIPVFRRGLVLATERGEA